MYKAVQGSCKAFVLGFVGYSTLSGVRMVFGMGNLRLLGFRVKACRASHTVLEFIVLGFAGLRS